MRYNSTEKDDTILITFGNVKVKSSILEVRKKLRDKAASDPNLKHNFEQQQGGGGGGSAR